MAQILRVNKYFDKTNDLYAYKEIVSRLRQNALVQLSGAILYEIT